MLAGIGDCQGTRIDAGNDGIDSLIKRSQGSIIVIIVASHDQECPHVPEGAVHISGLSCGSLLLLCLGEGALLQKPFLIQLCHIGHVLLEDIRRRDIDQLAINHASLGLSVISEIRILQ